MKKIFHGSSTRGEANHGWLHAKHSFSFANYFNPERIQFGALRVLNDDTVAPGMGFGTHPHDNMEIINIPLEGALEHKDSMENVGVIEADEIQVMSAGTGVYHSEYNRNKDQAVSLLQIWVFPNEQNVEPRYDQKNIKDLKKVNALYPVVTQVKEAVAGENAQVLVLAVATEADINELETYEERQLFLEDLGLDEPGAAKLIRSAYTLLKLETYFTAGEKEVRAWTIPAGATAPQAAGVIHTDFEKGFIRAEVISYADYDSFGSEQKAKEAGKARVEGKEYIVQDGDVMHFRFNV